MTATKLNLNQLPGWTATFCVCNIILAISATILVTHGIVLKTANEDCLENLVEGTGNCTGILPSCTLEKALSMAQGSMFFYSNFLGWNCIFWMIYSCCQIHFRKQR